MQVLTGGCHCGNLRVQLELTRPLDAYSPRACDCDFCSKHYAAYLSDPDGSLLVQITDDEQCGRYRQGSGRAEFLVCRACGVLVAVLHRAEDKIYAAVNARVIDGAPAFATEQPVSPKTLSETEKTKRWQSVWFSNVALNTSKFGGI